MQPTLPARRPRRPPPLIPQVEREEAAIAALLDIPLPPRLKVAVPGLGPRPETIVCACVQVPLGELQSCVARGCRTVDELARETGATTVCGSCVAQVEALVEEQSAVPVRLTDVRRVLPDVRSFRFEATDPMRPLRPHLPGQHIILSGCIDGRRISRPYTLTSVPGDCTVCEITVKRETRGLFSSSLFGGGEQFTDVQIGAPRGGFYVDVDRPEPVVFLVGGIGVTPALAVARAIAARKLPKRLHIDYSARVAGGHAFADDLLRLASRQESISVLLRETATGGRFSLEDARAYHRRYPDAHFYICGPDSYQEAVSRSLRRAGASGDRIHVEAFTPSRRADEAVPHIWRDRGIVLVGLLLLSAYLAQGALGLEWPWLRALQDEESYRRWSGAALLTFVAAQWVLPVQRLRGKHRAAATAYPWHRWLGALAPVFFYAHAESTGYGYLLALSFVYLANVAVGLADKTLVRDPALRERYARLWLVPHVVLAFLTVGLALFHVIVVFAYE